MAKSGFATGSSRCPRSTWSTSHTVEDHVKEPYAPFLNHLANPSFLRDPAQGGRGKVQGLQHPDAVIGNGPLRAEVLREG